jgi:hypothetical protein
MGTATHVALGIFAAVTLLLKRITDEFDGIYLIILIQNE